MMNYQDKLKAEMEICELHENRLKISLMHITPLLPLKPQFFADAKDEELAFLDMVAMRFAKLQDALGKKIFPFILRITNDYEESDTFIDRLNRLERLGVIDSVQNWQALRDIRNAISHEYENDLDKLCKIFNYFIEKCYELLVMWENVKKYIVQKKMLNKV